MNETGCGIGLHLSQQLVQKLGGCIEVNSALGRGTEFSFQLPIRQNDSVVDFWFFEEQCTSRSMARSSVRASKNLFGLCQNSIEEEMKEIVIQERNPNDLIVIVATNQ